MTTPGILVRTLACFLLVFATWNPTGYNFVAWARHSPWATPPEIAVAGTLLLALHILFLRIAWLSLGADGITAAIAIMLAGGLTLYQFDIIDLWQSAVWPYLLLSGFALLLAIGMTWSLLKRRIVGQSNYLGTPP
ncbi:MAG: DUF6524 family protein [Acetobacteraceae bacterium]